MFDLDSLLDLNYFWFLVGLVVIFTITSYGLHQRTRWKWYLGWVLMFLLSGCMGGVFVTGMLKAASPNEIVHGLIYLGVGLCIWVSIAVWWAGNRGQFGPDKRNPKQPPAKDVSPHHDV